MVIVVIFVRLIMQVCFLRGSRFAKPCWLSEMVKIISFNAIRWVTEQHKGIDVWEEEKRLRLGCQGVNEFCHYMRLSCFFYLFEVLFC